MEILTLENLALNRKPATCQIDENSISIKTGDRTIELMKENIKNFELFRGVRAFCFRICYTSAETHTNVFYDLHNIHESLLVKLRPVISTVFGFTLPVQELETLLTTQGNLVYTNDLLTLQSEKQVLSIPKSSIKKVIELDTDLQLDLGDIELVFSTSSNVAQFIADKQSEEICLINGINCINPRSKSTIVFFTDYFVLRGSSYDHTISFSDVTEIFFLKTDPSFYLMLKLENGIVQGQTTYESLVFLLTEKEVEVVAKDPRMKSHYVGPQHDVVLEIFESLLRLQAQESELCFRCTSKVFEGHLYLLEQSLLFLPKSICIPLEEISHVEFSRINLSVMQAKTFDMTVYASKVHNFSGIQKDGYGQIEQYLNEKGIKMISETIRDSYSEESDDGDESSEYLSDIVEEDEE